ncbi:glycohydrolase toxin TNT-related protein [Massilia aurea]
MAPYYKYEVTKPISVDSDPAIPWLDEVGMAPQYKTEKSVEQ